MVVNPCKSYIMASSLLAELARLLSRRLSVSYYLFSNLEPPTDVPITFIMKFSIYCSLLFIIESTGLSIPHTAAKILHPKTTALYNVTDGATQTDVEYGRVRNVAGDNSLITTLVTFSVPSSWSGKKCSLALETSSCNAPKQIDLFTTLNPLPGQQLASETEDGNHRDQFAGRFVVRGHKIAFWELISNRGPEFHCPGGKNIGYELVGVYNTGELTWPVDADYGPMIELRSP